MSAASKGARSAKEIKAQAASWLERRDREDWSPADQLVLEEWLAESLAHATSFWRLEAGWGRTERLGALREPMRASGVEPISRWPNPARIVAALCVIATLGAFGTRMTLGSHEHVYTTPIGGHEIITLRDGSSIELNTDTSLRVALDGNTRAVTLDKGEAYFQVVHDASHPFVVNVAGHRVTDLGTKFLMRKDVRRVEVALYEGRASFELTLVGSNSRKAILAPGDVVVAGTGQYASQQVIKNEPAQMLVNKLAWQRGFLVMNHTTLAEAVRDLNRYNTEKIVIANPAAAQLEMYGTVPINGASGFVRVVQSVLGLRVEKHGNEIVISQ